MFPPTDQEVEIVLKASRISQRERKRRLIELTSQYATHLRSRSVKILEIWRKQGVPHDIWVKIKERVDLVRKYNLKPRAPRENQSFIQDELTQLDGQIESLDKDVCSDTDFQNDTGVENC
ncbi:Uncharacterized protein APZ42_004315 [Daphnia magna]|uniref:Uncharacterized protein n=1 Tax=Daphnia magna TaxID=35525 RepID=A0A164H507_9CRUS|nr:Uncharacterized protein APZ42_004315 [Daphnia magna]